MLLWVLPLLPLGTLIACFFGVPVELFGALFIVNLSIAGRLHKRIAAQQARTERQFNRFRKYALLLGEIEQQNFSAALNKQLFAAFVREGKPASAQLRQLAGILQSLDSLNNVFGWLLLNGFMLWNLRYVLRLEKWKA